MLFIYQPGKFEIAGLNWLKIDVKFLKFIWMVYWLSSRNWMKWLLRQMTFFKSFETVLAFGLIYLVCRHRDCQMCKRKMLIIKLSKNLKFFVINIFGKFRISGMILKTYKLLKIRSSNLLTKTRSDPTPPKGGPYTIQSKSHGFIWRLCSGTHKLHYFMIIILKNARFPH